MSTPIISVVMSAYNAERFLHEAVESILGQTFSQFEFIVVDDGSTDGTAGILDRFQKKDARVRITHANHSGLADALNVGCAMVRSKYIARMDSDDVACPDRLETQLAFLEKHPEIAVVGSAVQLIDADGETLGVSRNPSCNADIQRELLTRCPIWNPTVMIRTLAFDKVGGYRTCMEPAEDYDFWLRVAEHFRLANLDRELVRYRLHGNQISVQKRQRQTFGVLAARAAAKLRRCGKPDPLEHKTPVTSELLMSLGVSQLEQRRQLFEECRLWFSNLCLAGDTEAAIKAGLEALQIERRGLPRGRRSDICLEVASLYRQQDRILKSIVLTARAVMIRPVVLGRPIKRRLAGI